MALTLATRLLRDLGETSLKDLAAVVGGRQRPWWQRLLPPGLTREGVVLEQHIREGRFQRSLALIAGLASLPSGFEVLYEHYRGSYSQLIMYSPIVLSPLLFVAGVRLWMFLAAGIVIDDLDAAIGKPHVPHLGIAERVGIDIGAVIAWNSLTQVINADCWHEFDGWPWLGMRAAAVCSCQLPWHGHR